VCDADGSAGSGKSVIVERRSIPRFFVRFCEPVQNSGPAHPFILAEAARLSRPE
jgi:hypothetical protein